MTNNKNKTVFPKQIFEEVSFSERRCLLSAIGIILDRIVAINGGDICVGFQRNNGHDVLRCIR